MLELFISQFQDENLVVKLSIKSNQIKSQSIWLILTLKSNFHHKYPHPSFKYPHHSSTVNFSKAINQQVESWWNFFWSFCESFIKIQLVLAVLEKILSCRWWWLVGLLSHGLNNFFVISWYYESHKRWYLARR